MCATTKASVPLLRREDFRGPRHVARWEAHQVVGPERRVPVVGRGAHIYVGGQECGANRVRGREYAAGAQASGEAV